MRFGGDTALPWKAIRVLLAEKFGVLPSALDNLNLTETIEILGVLDGEGKAINLHNN